VTIAVLNGLADPPNAATLRLPINDARRAFDEHLLGGCRAVNDAALLTRAATRGLDPLAVGAAVDDDLVARLCVGSSPANGPEWSAGCAWPSVIAGDGNMDLARG
jgi:hypothetical protein